jgi:two-component system response regulator YesN
LFRDETGCYFSDYLNQIRLQQAQELLKTTHLKGVDIAKMIGFSDPNYFYRKFKQIIGCSPTQYRQSLI